MNRQEIKLNKIVGITKYGEIVMLREVFNYVDGLHGKPFHGACTASFNAVDQNYIDERNDVDNVKDNYDYLWKEAVQSGNTELGLNEYIEELIELELSQGDGEFIGHDTSYIYDIPKSFKEEYFPDAVTFECVGGGRSSYKRSDFETIIDKEALNLMLNIESDKADLSIFEAGEVQS